MLLQRSTPWSSKRKQKKQDNEWTWRVGVAASAELAPAESDDAIEVAEGRKEIEVRVEGPYIPTEIEAFRTADRIICIVGGTGLTGAYSLAMWWLSARSKELNATFVLVWTVRYRDTALLREWHELEERTGAEGSGKISLKVHVSSEVGRLDVGAALRQRLSSQTAEYHAHEQDKEAASIEPARSAWVYVSGPEGLLQQADHACVNLEHEVRAAKRKRRPDGDNYIAVETLDHYVAKWEV
jgi:NAD(P)H-flavin reductase